MGIIAAMLCLCLCLIPCTAFAVSTADAKEPILTEKDCTLTVSYRAGEISFSGETVELYKIADASPSAKYTLAPSFEKSKLVLNGIQTNSEWNIVRWTLESYILSNKTEPVQIGKTDAFGKVTFSGLEPGLYMVSALQINKNDLDYLFDSALVALPGLDSNGSWEYKVSVSAKPEILPPIFPDGETEFKVIKLWKGEERKADRPSSIEVEIYRNGKLYETVVLSEKNHWSYSWSAKDDGARWDVSERNVPKNYSVTLEERGTAFVLTNTYSPEGSETSPEIPPDTGDTFNFLLYAVLMFVSGAVLILFGITGKRNRHEET